MEGGEEESIVRVNLEEEHRGMEGMAAELGEGRGRAEEEQGIATVSASASASASDRGRKGEGVEIGSIIQTKRDTVKSAKNEKKIIMKK